jgi:hypothetical protein
MPDSTTMDAVFARLQRSIEADNPNTAIHAVLKLGHFCDDRNRVPDELIERLLTLIGTQEVLSSIVAATILQFFESEARRFTKRQKRRCLDFLTGKVDQFKDADSLHIAHEIVAGNYLK